ncbi:uncharacterized protein PpBr36_06305 [Pyricularia pennisetigena]|uniref:uncharacterized protein n=1 Tax=Pyricularia pennisetigena TaxID=1578925 RepID=UPI00114F1C7D|nr:uncharacterized protein PpBr36_06305 [Pyricularia pennisetigena]TLS22821.1 hypothetical protein PpBr36_06305 [Pyricularia pennisetigena]
MATTNDKAMCRLLFAMLKQKNLKDIDWNKVAADPVLLQPITNGHAARMRYSRFKASMDPEAKLHKSADNATRVTKPRKEKGVTVKGKQPTSQDSALDETPIGGKNYTASPFANVKLESPSFAPLPTPTTCVVYPDSQVRFHNRLMTPSSDLMGSPVSEFLNAEAFEFSPASDTQCSPDHEQQPSWHNSPTYLNFGMPPNFGEQASSAMVDSHMYKRSSSAMAPETPKKEAPAPTAQEAAFFMYVMKHNKNAPDVDWDAVAQDANLKNGGCARTRFRQIKVKLGFAAAETGTPSPASKPVGVTKKTSTPKTPRGKGKKKTEEKADSISQDEFKKEESQEASDDNPFKFTKEQEEEDIFAKT